MKESQMRFLILCLALSLSATVQAKPLKKNTTVALCGKVVRDVFHFTGNRAKKAQKQCRTAIQTEVTNYRNQKLKKGVALTGMDAMYDLKLEMEGESLAASGTARVLFDFRTKENGQLTGNWRVSREGFTAKKVKTGVATTKQQYREALEGNSEFEKFVKKVSEEQFNATTNGMDFWDIFEDYMDPHDMPDMAVRNHEMEFFIFEKDGQKWPYAINQTYEYGSTEWNPVEFDDGEDYYLANPDAVIN
jgi:hypothetical protein